MDPYISIEEELARKSQVQATRAETDMLVQRGLSAEEIASLIWLRQWYQAGGSDRVQFVRRWGFLKFLVKHGKLEV